MLEVYGPEAIYNQLQSHRNSLEIERARTAQERPDDESVRNQQQQQPQRPQLSQSANFQQQFERYQTPSHQIPYPPYSQQGHMAQPYQNYPPQAMHDAQNRFQAPHNWQDLTMDSSSSSTVTTPTSTGPLLPPSTPTGKRRGRGRGANLGSRQPSEQQLLGSPMSAEKSRIRFCEFINCKNFSKTRTSSKKPNQ